MAREYGLADTLYSTMAEFFDYDNDGDLDMYLTINDIPKGYNTGYYKPIVTDGSFPSTGRLYRNDWNDSLKHPVFTDVSKQAGITIEGFGHDATIADINQDGWKDIYVSNDFLGDDILYINNHDGTFTDKVKTYFKHTSANGMGQDIEDINNDGLADVVELDMDPPDNYQKETFSGSATITDLIRTMTISDININMSATVCSSTRVRGLMETIPLAILFLVISVITVASKPRTGAGLHWWLISIMTVTGI